MLSTLFLFFLVLLSTNLSLCDTLLSIRPSGIGPLNDLYLISELDPVVTALDPGGLWLRHILSVAKGEVLH